MKKLIGFISAAVILMMAACTKDAPGPIVEKAMNDMINGNYEAFIDACDLGEDSLPADQVKQGKELAISMLKKTMDGIKEGKDEEAKKKLPKSCKVLDEQIDGDKAVVELEITSVGGETSNSKIQLKKKRVMSYYFVRIKGAWMMKEVVMNLDEEATEEGAEDEVAEDETEEAAPEAEGEEEPAEDAADAEEAPAAEDAPAE